MAYLSQVKLGNSTYDISAVKLKTARTISLTGSVTGSGSFDGSGNLSIATTTNHNHSDTYVDVSGDTMTGNLFIKGSNPYLGFKNSSGTISGYVQFIESNNTCAIGNGVAKSLVITDTGSITIPASQTFTPVTTNTGSVGTSTAKWNAMYATTFNGDLNGNATSATAASKLKGGTKLTSETIDGFLEANQLKWATADQSVVGNDGIIVSLGWSDVYGAQLWLDDGSGEGGMKIRNRGSSGASWNEWRQVLTEYNYTDYAAPASHSHSYLPLSGGTMSGEINMNNSSISNINHLTFSDPGVQEGITWTGGNGWYIYESPDDLTNAAGNLQFTHGSTRRLTIRTDGTININGTLQMSGPIQTSFKSSVAMGSYQAAATTIPNLIEEVRYSSGCMGSVSIGTAYTASNGGTIAAGWYNFIYSPHRSGGNNGTASGDNHQYGNLILMGMTDNFGCWNIRVSGGTISTSKKIWLAGDSVTGAVWNDYAECRESDCEDFGYVLMEVGDDSLTKTTERLSHFAGISSDTWGFSQGETDKAKTPIAVAGRVLVYTYQDRNNYKPGDCVCAAPGGTVDIMTREEVINWPDRIVGTVSCVPDYEEWGGGEGADREPVKINNRIWIKVR